ncbi:MAG: hypothetical protein K6D38_05270 [Pseudobutyrivibrio sp.]|nr:hypothetical protein [Pseudobutyrivibrio sp.]
MKRKVVTLGLIAAMALSVVGCGKDANVVGDTQASSDVSKSAGSASIQEVSYKGTSISIDSNPEDLVKALGEPDEKYDNDLVLNAETGESTKMYIYKYENDGLILSTREVDGKEEIADIICSSKSIVLKNGIKMDASEDAVKAAYGEPPKDSVSEGCGGVTFSYEDDKVIETFSFVNGKLTNVSISNKKFACEC